MSGTSRRSSMSVPEVKWEKICLRACFLCKLCVLKFRWVQTTLVIVGGSNLIPEGGYVVYRVQLSHIGDRLWYAPVLSVGPASVLVWGGGCEAGCSFWESDMMRCKDMM